MGSSSLTSNDEPNDGRALEKTRIWYPRDREQEYETRYDLQSILTHERQIGSVEALLVLVQPFLTAAWKENKNIVVYE